MTPPRTKLLNHKAVAPLLLTGLAFAAYTTSLHGQFVFDDQAVIFQNPALMYLKSFAEIFQFTGFRQPLYVTYGLDAYLGGLDPFGYHVTNVVLHAANAIIIFYILREIGAERWPALAGSGLFVVHPLFTGAVSYLAGRSSVLCGTFYFLAILAFLRGLKAASPVYAALNFGLSALAAVLAWSTKQEAITLPLFLGTYMWIRADGRRSVWHWPVLALLGVIPIAAVLFFKDELGRLSASVSQNAALVAAGFDPALPLRIYIPTYVTALVGYILPRFILPVGLSVDPDVRVVSSWYSPEFIISICVLLGLGALVVWLKRSDKLLLRAGIAGIVVSPLAAYAVMPLADVIQEHRIYIAGLGFALIAAWIADWSYRRFNGRGAAAFGIVILVCAVMTSSRNRVWADSTSLWQDATRKAPGNARSHVNLGVAYQDTNRPSDALKEYETALRLKPDLHLAEANAGNMYFQLGDLERSRRILENVRQSARSFPEGWWNLGKVYIAMKQPERALEVLNQALEIAPDLALAWFSRGDALALNGQYDPAVDSYKRGLSLRPDLTPFQLRLGALYRRAGNLQAAEQEFRALAADPQVGADANRNLGVMRRDAGDYAASIAYFQRALAQRPMYPDVHHDLGIVFLSQGMADKAIQEIRIALTQDPGFEAAFLTLATAYEKNGQIDQARQVLTDYLQKFASQNSAYSQEARSRLQTLQ